MREIMQPCMDDMSMIEIPRSSWESAGIPPREGRAFRMPNNQATGYFWVYAEADFAVSVTDMTFAHDYREICRHPRFVSVRYYRSGGYRTSLGRVVEAPYLEGHVFNAWTWDCVCRAGRPLQNVEIMLAPPFYERYLREVYAGEPFCAEEVFASVDGITDFPEMVVLLGQVEAFRGRNASARLFYRSKVEEAVALLVDRSRALVDAKARKATPAPAHHISQRDASAHHANRQSPHVAANAQKASDMHALELVRRHLEEHACERVSADELARLSCMGQTKLRRAFKQAHGCTIIEYQQRLRCRRAAELLSATDLPVASVAHEVGYRTPARFSELFERHFQLTPASYRAATRSAT